MDINQSTADGQLQIIENLFTQANVGDPADSTGVEDISEYVVFMHSHLGTGEHLESVRCSCSIEVTSVHRLQPVVFAMGLFHYQMALTDVLWKMYIEPKHLCTNPNGLYQHACKSYPHESGKIGSKPGFWLVHNIMHQCGYARMLNVWEVDMWRRNQSHSSLSNFAASKPMWDAIFQLSIELAQTYLDKPDAKSKLFQNNSLILARLIQYMELTHAMKHGDIGQVEKMFIDSVLVFKTVGKHKYAMALVDIMHKLNYVFPHALREHSSSIGCAILLANLTASEL